MNFYQVVLPIENTPEAGAVLAGFIDGQIPEIAEIEPRPDPVLGHVFTWPKQEVDQFTQGDQNV